MTIFQIKRMSTRQKSPNAKERREPTGKPAWWVRPLAVVLSPILFLGLVELVLSLTGYGYSKSFFLRWKAWGRTFYLANSHYGEHFVPKELSRTPEPCVLGRKSDSRIRIFVLGSSAAYGDPEPAYGFCRQLELLLKEHTTGNAFEVINTAMTAMNSHVVRRIAQDFAGISPISSSSGWATTRWSVPTGRRRCRSRFIPAGVSSMPASRPRRKPTLGNSSRTSARVCGPRAGPKRSGKAWRAS